MSVKGRARRGHDKFVRIGKTIQATAEASTMGSPTRRAGRGSCATRAEDCSLEGSAQFLWAELWNFLAEEDTIAAQRMEMPRARRNISVLLVILLLTLSLFHFIVIFISILSPFLGTAKLGCGFHGENCLRKFEHGDSRLLTTTCSEGCQDVQSLERDRSPSF